MKWNYESGPIFHSGLVNINKSRQAKKTRENFWIFF